MKEHNQLITDYFGIKEYEEFINERMRLKNKTIKPHFGYWQFTDEKLLDLRRKYELDPVQHRIKLTKIYDEITKRRL